jgi:predicted amidohydrolase
VDAAIETIRQAAVRHRVWVIAGTMYKRFEDDPPFNLLVAYGPDGAPLQRYHKVWRDERAPELPQPFQIDGVRCATSICADRWSRAIEELPAVVDGVRVLIECSNNFAHEWLPELEWFWYVPRALRNGCYVVFANTAGKWDVPGHGHSAVIGPDGTVLAALGGERDELLVCDLDPARATGAEARRRHAHPLLRDFWELGGALLQGKPLSPVTAPERAGAETALTVAAAQIAGRASVAANAAHMAETVERAARGGADLVVFPELALTGRDARDVERAQEGELGAAWALLQRAARAAHITVVFGTPRLLPTGRRNSAIVLGPDGAELTRYDELAVRDPRLFEPGASTAAMWFTVRGVPAVVTVGGDVLWNEIAELAAVRGALIHCHLANDAGMRLGPGGDMLRRQLWVNLAYRTLTVTVNAASPGAGAPEDTGGGGSVIWNDYGRYGRGRGQGPFSAVPVAEAGAAEELLFASVTAPASNPHRELVTRVAQRRVEEWYLAGANAVCATLPETAAAGR